MVYSTGRGVVTPRDVPLTQDLTRPRLRVGAGLGMKGILEIELFTMDEIIGNKYL